MKLHLGCGKRYLKGYAHVDLGNYAHVLLREDIRHLWWIKDSTVDLIYASHVIEYFDLDEIVGILKEWHRALKEGGILRLAVPDFEAISRSYIMIHADIDRVRGPLYGKWNISLGKTVYHKTVYDSFSLGMILEEAGFKNVRKWDWRKVFTGEHKGFDDYSQSYIPHMDKESGILISLNVEAEK